MLDSPGQLAHSDVSSLLPDLYGLVEVVFLAATAFSSRTGGWYMCIHAELSIYPMSPNSVSTNQYSMASLLRLLSLPTKAAVARPAITVCNISAYDMGDSVIQAHATLQPYLDTDIIRPVVPRPGGTQNSLVQVGTKLTAWRWAMEQEDQEEEDQARPATHAATPTAPPNTAEMMSAASTAPHTPFLEALPETYDAEQEDPPLEMRKGKSTKFQPLPSAKASEYYWLHRDSLDLAHRRLNEDRMNQSLMTTRDSIVIAKLHGKGWNRLGRLETIADASPPDRKLKVPRSNIDTHSDEHVGCAIYEMERPRWFEANHGHGGALSIVETRVVGRIGRAGLGAAKSSLSV